MLPVKDESSHLSSFGNFQLNFETVNQRLSFVKLKLLMLCDFTCRLLLCCYNYLSAIDYEKMHERMLEFTHVENINNSFQLFSCKGSSSVHAARAYYYAKLARGSHSLKSVLFFILCSEQKDRMRIV